MATSVFGATKVTAPRHNIFDLSHSVKTTVNSGRLHPVVCMPVVPGDSFDIKADLFCRLAPLATPVLANIDIRLEAFYVPNRLLWPNWEKFIVFEHRPKNDPKPSFPYVNLGTAYQMQESDNYNRVGIKSLADDLGIPVQQLVFDSDSKVAGTTQDHKVSALPFAAYQKIWRDYYIDKNIQQSDLDTYFAGVDGEGGLFDGDNTSYYPALFTYHDRMWRKDYFTSALPDAQRGADVLIPVTGGDVSIQFKNQSSYDPAGVIRTTSSDPTLEAPLRVGQTDADNGIKLAAYGQSGYEAVTIDNSSSLKGQVNGVNATITDLRTAMATQRLLELSMRVGSRLKEQLLGIFGVKTSDSRLQRAEYLGGSSVPIMIGEVAQTSATASGTTPQANMAGKGIAAGQLTYGRKYFEEHGYLIVILSVVPKASYFQGLERHWRMMDMEDFYWPMFQHIGEQAIRKEELFLSSDQDDNDSTFGYAPRYSEYKWHRSSVHSEFRGDLLNMHTARVFANQPSLNADFLNINDGVTNRCFAVTSGAYSHYWIDIYFKIKAKRPMDYFGSPM